jgi:hypothetical protein
LEESTANRQQRYCSGSGVISQVLRRLGCGCKHFIISDLQCGWTAQWLGKDGLDGVCQRWIFRVDRELKNKNSVAKKSDAHGHDDVAVAVGFVGEGAHLAGGLFVLELDADGAIGGGCEEVKHVSGIETDGDGIAGIFLFDIFLGFAVLGAGSGNFDAFVGDRELDGVRALVGELRNAADGVA